MYAVCISFANAINRARCIIHPWISSSMKFTTGRNNDEQFVLYDSQFKKTRNPEQPESQVTMKVVLSNKILHSLFKQQSFV